MPNRLIRAAARRPRRSAALLAAVAGAAALAVASLALASSFTLKVRRDVHVTNNPFKTFRVKAVNTHEAVAYGPSGFAVYTFQGETTHHIICKKTSNPNTNCWGFWPPVSPAAGAAISKNPSIPGRLGKFRNHGVTQLTLNGQPLYYFTPDIKSRNKLQAQGDELKTFGSIWHIVKAVVMPASTPSPMPTTSTTSTMPTTTNPYPWGNTWG
jgi:predicted lipoprotein with Yx(FWY)xxD motif